MSQHQANSASVSLLSGASQRNDQATSNGRVVSDVPALWLGITQTAWIQIGVITALFGFLFWPNLRRLWDKTNPFYGEANWGHAIGIPIIGLYYLYVNREKLLHPQPARSGSSRLMALRLWMMAMLVILLPLPLIQQMDPALLGLKPAMGLNVSTLLSAPMLRFGAVLGLVSVVLMFLTLRKPSAPLIKAADVHSAGWFGGYIMIFGILLFAYGIYPGQNDFVKDFGMVVTLFGVVTALVGWPVMRIAWFPIVFLVCGIPWPGLVYSKIAGPLQQLAAHVAVFTLQLTGVAAQAGGTKIMIDGYHGAQRTLNVAEACAGLRSLMTFISVAAAVAFLSSRALWQQIIIVLSAIPIAIFCNVMRVSGQGLLDHYVSQQLSENFAHQFVGLLMMIPAFLLILLVAWILDQLFLEQVDRSQVAPPKIISRSIPQPSAAQIQQQVLPAAPSVIASSKTSTPVSPEKSPAQTNHPASQASTVTTSAPAPVAIKNAAPALKDAQRTVAIPKPAPPSAAPATPQAAPAKPSAAPIKLATPAPKPAAPAATPKAATPRAVGPAAPPMVTPPPSVRLASKPRPAAPTPLPKAAPTPLPKAAPPKPRTDKPTGPGSNTETP